MEIVKHVIALIVLSFIVVLALPIIGKGIDLITALHSYFSVILGYVFSDGYFGRLLQNTLALLLFPFIFGIVIGGIYYAIRKQQMPYLMIWVWVIWVVLSTALATAT